MAGYSCDNEATNVSSSESGLLERLIAGPSDTAEPETAQSGPSQPQQMPATQALHLQVTYVIKSKCAKTKLRGNS